MVAKAFIYLFNMPLVKTYKLQPKKFCHKMLSHHNFRHHIAQYIIAQALPIAPSTPSRVPNTSNIEDRLVERQFLSHFLQQIKRKNSSQIMSDMQFYLTGFVEKGHKRYQTKNFYLLLVQ